jgi:hypothetical protein
MSNKYRVFVTGELDTVYEIEAGDGDEAMSVAEDHFSKGFPKIQWSSIHAHEWELIEGEEEEDDGY